MYAHFVKKQHTPTATVVVARPLLCHTAVTHTLLIHTQCHRARFIQHVFTLQYFQYGNIVSCWLLRNAKGWLHCCDRDREHI